MARGQHCTQTPGAARSLLYVTDDTSCCAHHVAGSKLKPAVLKVAGSTAPFTVGLSPQAEMERAVWLQEERMRQEAFQQAESAKLRRTIEDQLRVELNDVLEQHSFTWRSIFCCCFPKRKVRAAVFQRLPPEDAAAGHAAACAPATGQYSCS